ncbi:uncharacterized protein LTR77_002683 [Saxophila tyrrhenica]|uniref:Xaa-Pro dipeptidyl-peptidase-like domain-containing protein n=1 Tax=Saxophila tyrrhenica TaxID=1690608 RepID=A0AAV9PJH1_9PEZI|nr:hypothetical protein LTR77_002683 [Saxophila tyrrhenica]
MPRKNISFKTSDGLTLKGWFCTPDKSSGKLPCLVMAHGWSALKEMDLDAFAEYFTLKLAIGCLVYDNRCFGDSEGEPRHEIIPSLQQSDYSDAITYAQSLEEVNAEKIGVWGSSYSGGHVLLVGAVDRRVKAVLGQVVELLRANDPSLQIHRIAPTPLLLTVAENDVLTPTDLSLEAYSRAREPKQLHIIPGGHFDGYTGFNFEKNAGCQAEFLKRTLCS